jgi:predicted alpha/beta superfamily hydrolase
LNSDTIVNIHITHWSDHFKSQPRKSTANRHVIVAEQEVYMPQLKRHRKIRIYLPESYHTSGKKYPVLYMHDGQNLFDDSTSFSGEWGIDEAMDSLGVMFGEMIIVGIDHGGSRRINEYAPYDMERFGEGEGDAYADFLVKTLRPYIRKNYRTKNCRKHQFIAGSSMGGLISFYAMLKYPRKFGGAGVFSPAFWVAPALKDEVRKKGNKVKGKIYFYAGKEESETMVPDLLSIHEIMFAVSKARLTTVIRTEGKHSESTWRKEFPLFYEWMRE